MLLETRTRFETDQNIAAMFSELFIVSTKNLSPSSTLWFNNLTITFSSVVSNKFDTTLKDSKDTDCLSYGSINNLTNLSMTLPL